VGADGVLGFGDQLDLVVVIAPVAAVDAVEGDGIKPRLQQGRVDRIGLCAGDLPRGAWRRWR